MPSTPQLEELGIEHHFELYEGNHSRQEHRYPEVWDYLAQAPRAQRLDLKLRPDLWDGPKRPCDPEATRTGATPAARSHEGPGWCPRRRAAWRCTNRSTLRRPSAATARFDAFG
jgi:hypothetical protein